MILRNNDKIWQRKKIDWIKHYWNLDHPMRKEIIRIIGNHPRFRSVLEIGCGAGANLFNIKKAFKDTAVAGCDINEDAIKTAKEQFKLNTLPKVDKDAKYDQNENPRRKDMRESGEIFLEQHDLRDVELKVGDATDLPFNGESYDLILTHAVLMYMNPNIIDRVLREIRRVGYNRMIFVELHSKKWFERLKIQRNNKFFYYTYDQGYKDWIDNKYSYYAYDYEKLLAKHHFKNVQIFKITKEMWPVELWIDYGYIITCIR